MIISGNLAYRERMLLSPGYKMTVSLLDTSIADIRAPIIGEISRELDNEQIPLSFTLSVDKAKLKPRGRYAVRGVLTDAVGDLAWTTDTSHMVDPQAVKQDMGQLMMVAVDAVDRNGAMPSVESRQQNYMCGDVTVVADYTTDALKLRMDGQAYELPRVPAASGAKYAKADQRGRVMFWSKADKATLEVNGKAYPECTAKSETAMMLNDTKWQVEDVIGGGVIDKAGRTLILGEDGR